jgi:hypothetical protein
VNRHRQLQIAGIEPPSGGQSKFVLVGLGGIGILDALTEGNVLIITRLDRLARSTRDLLDIVHTIETKGAKLKALTVSWADTTTRPSQSTIRSAKPVEECSVLGCLHSWRRNLRLAIAAITVVHRF